VKGAHVRAFHGTDFQFTGLESLVGIDRQVEPCSRCLVIFIVVRFSLFVGFNGLGRRRLLNGNRRLVVARVGWFTL
jgi:hypothetical protein